jgi:23S rRNA (cytidine1920-2'-O)/16S rRNA (cytidine1409-2'-O)-methyltransferase
MRADQLIVNQGLAPTRSAAQRLIAGGGVQWLSANGWVVPRKAGEDLPEGCELKVTDDAELRFVGRGGLKLEGALKHVGIDVAGMTCLDIGQSTGGFTDALLQQGAVKVVGVDVGHGQLHRQLVDDVRVQAFEGMNARHLSRELLGDAVPAEGFDLIVGDLSFISLTLVIPALEPLLGKAGALLLLVKPQFELQPEFIGKGGIVKNDSSFAIVETRIRQACIAEKLVVHHYFASPIDGGDGNHEFFVHARRDAKPPRDRSKGRA